MNLASKIIFLVCLVAVTSVSLVSGATLTVVDVAGTLDDRTLEVPITIDNPESIVGAAFTIKYPDALSVQVDVGNDARFFEWYTDQFSRLTDLLGAPIEEDHDDWEEGVTKFPKLDESGEYVEVPVEYETGQLREYAPPAQEGFIYHHVAAARCRPAPPLAEGDPPARLFLLIVTLNDGEAWGDYPIDIIPTEMDDPDLGYDNGPEPIDMVIGNEEGTNNFTVIIGVSDVDNGTVTFNSSDLDNDGLPDAWELGFDNIDDLSQMSSTGDYDKDGKTDLSEYNNGTDGTDPTVPDGSHFSGVVSSSLSIVFYGDYFKINGLDAQPGDEVGVYDPAGTLCGIYNVSLAGEYLVKVYGDDSSTADVDEGAEAGDELTFKIWDASESTEITLTQTMFLPASVAGNPASPDNPPQWTASEDAWGLNIAAGEAGGGSLVIPLHDGWNLISFNVNQFFYWGDTVPDVPMLSGIETVRVNSIDDVLTSINGKYEIISSFDKDGAHTYDPALPGFSDLKYLAAGYGYWIKMTEAADLILPGALAGADATLALNVGWNLVGCWHPDAQYVGVEPSESLPYGTQAVPVDAIDTVFGTINGAYEIISSFDEDGAHTYDPALPGFSDLKYVAPGYGYWIKMTQPRDLNY